MALSGCFYSVVPLQCRVLETETLYGCLYCCAFSGYVFLSTGHNNMYEFAESHHRCPLMIPAEASIICLKSFVKKQ